MALGPVYCEKKSKILDIVEIYKRLQFDFIRIHEQYQTQLDENEIIGKFFIYFKSIFKKFKKNDFKI